MRPVTLLLATLAFGSIAPAATADTIATTTVNVPIAAGSGWIAWSVPLRLGGYGLVAWKDGRLRHLPVRSSQQPFALDAGTDARGLPVLTYPRCGGRSDGTDCRAAVLSLPAAAGAPFGRERLLTRLGSRVALVSMWHGRVAWSGLPPGAKHVQQLRVLDAGARAPRTLPHGPVPPCPRSGCRGVDQLPEGRVADLDLGPRAVAYDWRFDGPNRDGLADEQLRVQPLGPEHARVLASGYVAEFCSEGLDSVAQYDVTVERDRVWYVESQQSCREHAELLNDVGVLAGPVRRRRLGGYVVRLAKDGPVVVTTSVPAATTAACSIGYPECFTTADCAGAGGPCPIERIELPPVSRDPDLKPSNPGATATPEP